MSRMQTIDAMKKQAEIDNKKAAEASVTEAAKAVEEEEEAKDGRAERRFDPEILAIGRIVKLVDEIDEQGRPRAIRYLADRYGLNLGPAS